MPQGLDWGRLEASWYHNPKFLGLIAIKQWRSIVVYWAGLAHSIEQGTDGYIAPVALPIIHGTRRDAERLVDARLWDITPDEHGWMIHDYAEYQQTTEVTKMIREAQREGGRRGARARWDNPSDS